MRMLPGWNRVRRPARRWRRRGRRRESSRSPRSQHPGQREGFGPARKTFAPQLGVGGDLASPEECPQGLFPRGPISRSPRRTYHTMTQLPPLPLHAAHESRARAWSLCCCVVVLEEQPVAVESEVGIRRAGRGPWRRCLPSSERRRDLQSRCAASAAPREGRSAPDRSWPTPPRKGPARLPIAARAWRCIAPDPRSGRSVRRCAVPARNEVPWNHRHRRAVRARYLSQRRRRIH